MPKARLYDRYELSVLSCNGKKLVKFYKQFFSISFPLLRFQIKSLPIFLALIVVYIPSLIEASDNFIPQRRMESSLCHFMRNHQVGNDSEGRLLSVIQIILNVRKRFAKIDGSHFPFPFPLGIHPEGLENECYKLNKSDKSEGSGQINQPPIRRRVTIFFICVIGGCLISLVGSWQYGEGRETLGIGLGCLGIFCGFLGFALWFITVFQWSWHLPI